MAALLSSSPPKAQRWGSLRFPFSLPQRLPPPPKPPTAPALCQAAATAAAIGAGTGLAISISLERPAAAANLGESSATTTTPTSLAGGLPPAPGFVEPIPGVPFPTVLSQVKPKPKLLEREKRD